MGEQADLEQIPARSESRVLKPSVSEQAWGDLISHLPLGMFIVNGPDCKVKLNRTVGHQLGLELAREPREEEFWNAVCSLGAEGESAQQAVEQARQDLLRNGRSEFSYLTRNGIYLDIKLASLSEGDPSEGDYVGWISDGSRQVKKHMAEIETISEICGSTRMAAAGAAGNLTALNENLHSWNLDVVADFLGQAVAQIDRIQESLDLALSYTSLIRNLPVYRLPIEPGDLLAELVGKNAQLAVRIADNQQTDQPLPTVAVDLALTKVAVETLLNELLSHNLTGPQVEAVLTVQDEFLVLKFISPRTLPLPGLSADPASGHPAGLPAKLLVAREMLSTQGIKIALRDRPLQEGGGADMEIYFPVKENFRELTPVSQDTKDPAQQSVGRILLAEDQPEYQVRLREELTSLGYRVDLARDGSTALDMVQTLNPDLVILARNLPGMDGLLVSQGIRRWSAVPIIMISSRSGTDDQLYAYQLGVDDYLHKPILVEELLAKVRVFITRQQSLYQSSLPEIYQSGSVRIDNSFRQVWIRGSLVDLTPIEYNLLLYLSRQGRQIVTYEQLLESVWEGPEKGTRQGLFVHVRRLREKIELDPKNPRIIKNKWGVGYVFNP